MKYRGLLVAGTSSDAGKSLVTTGICRFLSRQKILVAPFKAQNMSNNSMVCADGAEIGRAQYLQAQAANAEPESAMNPVLLKPGSDRRSHVVVRGRADGVLEAGEFATGRKHLALAAFEAYEELAAKYDVIISEGAGSPAEINLRAGDYVNMGLARQFSLPVVVVGDIDRGGIFASLYGTVGLLGAQDRALIKAFIINKFRGDVTLLKPGLDQLTQMTGVPFWGVLPWLPDVWLDGEDTLQVGRWRDATPVATTAPRVRIVAVQLPRLSNVTDLDALASEPGVELIMTTDPLVLASAEIIVLPGSRATVSDLMWLKERGLAEVIEKAAAEGVPILGICGGYQMMAGSIEDPIESKVGRVSGLALLPTAVVFHEEKVLGRPTGEWRGHPVQAYEIHHGVATVNSGEAFLDGCRFGSVWGTTWHGVFENDKFRRAWLLEVAPSFVASDGPGFAAAREAMIDTLADAVEENLDTAALLAAVGA
ncbi:cobyric acid synthase [Nakamurella antarctica]|uniref:Cobyric acid synthase n=1 Tax=Nakamurella antarctica TaxID=1902245 RepID=A0A3G8ZP38_9ACTN|nr:cobyric acid synthase [Nakamurella antarctica]AZI59023.1 cobyric acid synthase [Nakamurella antarctica]